MIKQTSSRIQWLAIGSSRTIRQAHGSMTNRTTGSATYSEMHLTKFIDDSSVDLLHAHHKSQNFDEVKIFLCHDDENDDPQMEYRLENVMISYIKDAMNANSGIPIESIGIHFTKIEKTFHIKDEKTKTKSPKRAGYDLEKEMHI